ncbi:ketoacyl-ACP synthase III [Actinocrinis puniceicyclus]|uniref:Ketoacyl-ACP synthase III n=1 Tax=Actinocrinis puniceicyclus TaxID=977794 RepID=A0A8J7WL63_9ACTN|nr:ketoacyl-ACP synthase III [Actinocrinis puniceicyclus]MBS2964381.1 ketoacyl-ACP synthase III [Actinocrinis puniceicyclus]
MSPQPHNPLAGKVASWRGTGLRFAGTGHYYPRERRDQVHGVALGARSYSAEDVAQLGVRGLHRAAQDEPLEYMAQQAGRAALDDAGCAPAQIDLLILANWTERQWIPELAPQVAALIDAPQALAFDLCGACTGFVHAVQVAASMLAAGRAWRRALVIAADRFSHRARPGTRGQLVFGDAAGAVVLERVEEGQPGLLLSVLHHDAAQADTVAARDGWLRPKPELIELAVRSSVYAAETLLGAQGLDVDEIDWLIPHPGNNAIHSQVLDRIGLPPGRFLTNFAQRGNTGCASIPIALSEFRANGLLKPGHLVLSTAVGSGWYYGGLLYQL